MITLTRTYFKYKNIIDGEHLAKGVDIIELFTKLPFARCLNFLENYWLIKAIEANPDNQQEAEAFFTNKTPTQNRMQISRAPRQPKVKPMDPNVGFGNVQPLV